MWRVPNRWRTPGNDAVIRFVEDAPLSAHSDVAEELRLGAAGLRGVTIWCADPAAYAYTILVSESGVIVGVAYGMDVLAVRLPELTAAADVANGATAVSEIGTGWVSVHPFDPNERTEAFRARFGELCRVAVNAAD